MPLRDSFRSFSPILLSAAVLALAACATAKPAVPAAPITGPQSQLPAPAASEVAEASAQSSEERERARLDLAPLYFELDSAQLKPESVERLHPIAEYLRQGSARTLRIAGHTCELGTTEYNLALGQRRAESVKAVLRRLGASELQLATISYGEEQPAVPGHEPEALGQNRRAELVIQLREDGAQSHSAR